MKEKNSSLVVGWPASSLSPRRCWRGLAIVSGLLLLALLVAACGAAPQAAEAPPAKEAEAAEAPAKEEPAKEEPAAAAQVEAEPTAKLAEAEAAVPGPKVGGTFRILGAGDFRTLDPPGAESSEDWWSAGMVLFNELYFYDKDGNFYADLAADMPQISDDGLVYTIPIRQGVKFHNGRELKAEDVKFTLERQLWPEVYSWGKTFMENMVGYQDVIDGKTKDLSGIKVLDDYTVEITLKQP